MKLKPNPVVAVKYVRFVGPQDGPGLSVASACYAIRDGRQTAWQIEYHPATQMFRIEHKGGGVEYIPLHRVAAWAVLPECLSDSITS